MADVLGMKAVQLAVKSSTPLAGQVTLSAGLVVAIGLMLTI